MDISKNFFEFFGLPVSFQIDQTLLSERYRELQKQLHPDRHAHLSDREQRLSVQYTAHLNEGMATLKSPLRRAQYLLLIEGIDTTGESSVKIDPMFLMQQMELRERLEDARDAADPFAELESLGEEVQSELAGLRRQFDQCYLSKALEEAAAVVRKMQFLEKLLLEIENLEDQLED
ncbi:Fe-S protein assembly co-chaperone HscB [Marinobacterium jannaschii]|uniref:Fe-S protein assembly co-chaperone HscB n=1 Tax=Marinobacterium jannaschii TaxID=64970 RepID=UPI00048907C9|nr:Fe-S protein assembly co-chaperone HscB [Marinobacterium jannaschii]